MRGVNDKNFFNAWQILYRSTCPNPTETHWCIDDVDWHKGRHSFFSDAYAMSIDVHTLRRRHARVANSWHLLIAVENWWNGKNELLKTTMWARVLEGNPRTIVAWMHAQERIPGRAGLLLPKVAPIESSGDDP